MTVPPDRPGPWAPKGVVAVLDTSVLVRAWLGGRAARTAAQSTMLLAGLLYDSFTSPAILEEVEAVLTRPRFGGQPASVQVWFDAFVRRSRQVFPEAMPFQDARAVGGDVDDLPVLRTALAVDAGAIEYSEVLAAAVGQRYLVTQNTTDFAPGRNVYGWSFVTVETFFRLLLARGAAAFLEDTP